MVAKVPPKGTPSPPPRPKPGKPPEFVNNPYRPSKPPDSEPAPFTPGGAGYVPPKPPPAPAPTPSPQPEPRDPGAGDGDDGWRPWSGGDVSTVDSYETQRQNNAIAAIKGMLDQYGLSSLYDKIVSYVKEGYDADTVMVLIRTTPEYKARFPAMEALQAKKRGISEAAYIQYEQLASGLERRYGLPENMLMSNVTKMLTNEVSASELNDRVELAASAAIQAPQDVRNMFQNYYNIGLGGQTAYFLDPDVAMPLLEKQFASAQIGTEAARQGIGINAYSAENLQSLGINQESARQGFSTVASEMGLTRGFGDVATQEELISGNLLQNEQARKSIERSRGAKIGAFQGGGGFASGYGQQSQSAIGSSSTT